MNAQANISVQHYRHAHQWAKLRINKPTKCNRCKEEKPLDLSNNSEFYLLDVTDWEWICRGCHYKKDRLPWNRGKFGYKMLPSSEIKKLKISLANKGQIPWNRGKKIGSYSKERMEKVWAGLRGKPAWNRGLKMSDAQCKKLSKSHLGQKAWNKGKPMNEETKRKLSEVMRGRSPWNKGLKFT